MADMVAHGLELIGTELLSINVVGEAGKKRLIGGKEFGKLAWMGGRLALRDADV